jgi:hypothetical protein
VIDAYEVLTVTQGDRPLKNWASMTVHYDNKSDGNSGVKMGWIYVAVSIVQ